MKTWMAWILAVTALLLSGCETAPGPTTSETSAAIGSDSTSEELGGVVLGEVGEIILEQGIPIQSFQDTLGDPWKASQTVQAGDTLITRIYREILEENTETEVVDYNEFTYTDSTGFIKEVREPVYGDIIVRVFRVSELLFKDDQLLTWTQEIKEEKSY